MRIFSKKTFQFDHPAGTALAVVVLAMAFADVPDWVAKSQMFELASQDGDVEVIGSKADEAAAEKGSNDVSPEVKEKLKQFASLSAGEQSDILKGLEIEPGQNKEERVQQYTDLLQAVNQQQ